MGKGTYGGALGSADISGSLADLSFTEVLLFFWYQDGSCGFVESHGRS
jgi:hypothetical protein